MIFDPEWRRLLLHADEPCPDLRAGRIVAATRAVLARIECRRRAEAERADHDLVGIAVRGRIGRHHDARRRACRTGVALRADRALRSDRTLRTRIAFRTGEAARSRSAHRAGCARRTGWAGWPRLAFWTGLTFRSRRALRTCSADRADRTCGAYGASWAGRTLLALRTDFSLRSARAGGALRPLGPLRTRLAGAAGQGEQRDAPHEHQMSFHGSSSRCDEFTPETHEIRE